MKSLQIGLTNSTPAIYFDKIAGKFEITGRSFPEEAIKFYQPIIDWINSYVEDPNKNTKFIFKMDYVNSASTRALNAIMAILERLYLKGFEVNVEWYYNIDDTELNETGKEFAEIYKMPIKLEGYVER
jgi:hypothetical protein